VIYASWKHRNTENYKFSWNKKYVMYWRIPGNLWGVIAGKKGKAYNARK
jgi:hypothetical protein